MMSVFFITYQMAIFCLQLIKFLLQFRTELLYFFMSKPEGGRRPPELSTIEIKTKQAVEKLKEAHAKWKSLPEEKRGVFNASWLQKNGFNSVQAWMSKNGGTSHFAKLIGAEVVADFEVTNRVGRTIQSATEEFQAAHAVWKNLPEAKRSIFNVVWLQKNYSSLYQWMFRNGGVSRFATLAGGEVERDFKIREFSKEKEQKQKFTDYVSELANSGLKLEEFKKLIGIFGASHCADILFRFRPEFKGLPLEYVKGTMADYLGDFLVVKGDFYPALESATEHLSADLSLQEGLYETLKENCLRYYYQQRKEGKTDSHQIIYGYLNHIVEQVGHLKNKVLDDIIQKVVLYYDSVLRDFQKPEQFIDELSQNREFPDINQRINMKELADKKQMLIADEMGTGKSASVIMAKEQLGAKCALVVAPANVIDNKVWQNYLSDKRDKGGYYKEGQAPRVLTVENHKDLKNVSANNYDYIIISQERMDKKYTALLEQIDYDMLIVDEVHKVKALEGKRAGNVIKLAEKTSGENKYMALLSGTPIPNKVEDIAVTLKLLYAEKFAGRGSKKLVRQIIHGDILDLRSLLLPRMQMKSLQESVEMPELAEKVTPIELSPAEREIYEVLLEEDELTATQKMILLRTFLLNPEIVDSTPNVTSAKVKALSESIKKAFEKRNKVIVFVNDYVEGVIRGEKTIIEKLNLPADIDVRVVHGDDKRPYREVVQKEFQTSSHKMLLLVSGQTADVGIDYSAGEKVIFDNEPWTEYQKKQELGRVYRPGLKHPLESETLITKGTIEQGIHEYIQRKYMAIEKLLRGVPITELEKELLAKDEKNNESDLSVNQELAEYYFASWDKLMRMFSYVKEIGEDKFQQFLSQHGKEYAGYYLDLGSRSYQANANRVAAAIIRNMIGEDKVDVTKIRVLDLASGPEMLKQHIVDQYQDSVFSIDINKEHFKKTEGHKRMAGSLLQMPFANGSFDYLNLSLSLHYTDFVPSQGRYARLQSLMEMNRVLRVGGKAVISLVYSMELDDMAKFKEVADMLGFKVVEKYSGEASAGKAYDSQLISLEKVRNIAPELSVEELGETMSKEQRDSLKFASNKKRLKDSRQVITSFTLNNQEIDIELNAKDKKILEEEREVKKQAEVLKSRYGGIDKVPEVEIIDNGFVRLKVSEKKYILFKKLTQGSGAVVVR